MQVPWWSAANMRLTMRETSIHDELLRLQPLDDEVRRTALAAAFAGRAPAAEADVVSAVVMVSAAVENRAHRPEVGSADHGYRTSAATAALTATLAPGAADCCRCPRRCSPPSSQPRVCGRRRQRAVHDGAPQESCAYLAFPVMRGGHNVPFIGLMGVRDTEACRAHRVTSMPGHALEHRERCVSVCSR